ncbi:hypothetical protein EJB05_38087, partial [Eragrostis curvula]
METPRESNNGGSHDEGNGGFMATCRLQLCSAVDKLRQSVIVLAGKLAKIARDDPRRVAHSLKVGLALTLVSVVYYVTPLFKGHTDNTMWAVLTVVVVMEFTIGGTLSKGLNRAAATLLAGFLAVGAHLVADLCGQKGEPILLGVFVFFVASAATFSRFIPAIKARHDYGVTIFILTFSLVAVSSYRVEELIQYAHQRFTTIVIGVATCLVTTIFVFPVWAGEDLNELTASNLDKLADFLDGIESKCFGGNTASENLEDKVFLQVYKSILNSKTREDSLYSFARWEPGHGKFSFRHPWGQYQKIGVLCRQCASSMEALASYVVTATKSPYPDANPELSLKVRRACCEMNLQSAKALRELSSEIRTMTILDVTKDMSAAMESANRLRSELSEDTALLQVMHVSVIASLLSDMVSQIKKLTESVENLARLANFKSPKRSQVGVVIDIVS